MGRHRSRWIVSGTVGLVWLATALLAAAVSLTPLSRVQQAVLPVAATPYVWSWPAPWPALLPLAGAVAVALVHATLLHLAPRSAPVPTTWLATVAAGATAGMTVDIALVFGPLLTSGWALWSVDLGSRAASGAYWGLLYGWIPALIAGRLARRAQTVDADAQPDAPRTGRRGLAITATVAVVALVALAAVRVGGDDASQAQLRAEAEQQEPPPADGSLRPDPDAAGEPVPEVAAGPGITDIDGCTPARATILLGSVDGATGHRGLSLELMNFSDRPCVIEGYPDIAFGDQNGHLLAVAVAQGGSFMGSDAGPTRVEIPAGGSAVATIGWDAASTQGALVTRTLWAAVLAGETRGSWPIDLDVVEGSDVAVTAWALRDPGAATEG